MQAAYEERFHRWQQMAIQSIAQRLRLDNGVAVTRNGAMSPSARAELTNDLLNLRSRMAAFGRSQFNDEMRRQGIR